MSKSNKESDPETTYFNERIRQAKLAFNLLVGATIISGIVGLIGAGLLMSNKLSDGIVTTSVGLASSMRFVKLAKDANDRLDEAIREAEEEDDNEES
ncbi:MULTISPECIES: hypothetical protein [Moorena]|uniref:Cyanobacterial TRADD-N associated 2 transmembrane domain-containing protein n=1 Tax=Moorena producens 3L TaxID=489825 RepID=F4Y1V9_9CYAN|nr:MULTISPECIES: hypothetical protein [Moorena]NEQ13714.1 hypothetical protein [Moorena sp. SIO3E2]NES86721.1 hypothetical protein [Moorena sp. SIO2B7]EGJ29251.1 hypothetical protein LYNGBM3L_67020 [Moorena producens 3L]NEP33185.1 hypothetical protein [Moorena sp. SIO3B2]NEP67421.1 hypothetical protein [Moorena sp. SIO3A5]